MRKQSKQKQFLFIGVLFVLVLSSVIVLGARKDSEAPITSLKDEPSKGCVFNTLMGIEKSDSCYVFKTSESVNAALDGGLEWILTAQQNNGGWGAGSHSRQGEMNPHAVAADPATTAMVAMALLRTDKNPYKGKYGESLEKAIEYLHSAVESSGENEVNITDLQGTQIQTKLGQNIDVVLTTQFYNNLLDIINPNHKAYKRTKDNLEVCVRKIENATDANGNIKGAGWAGVLQSSFANSALEGAQARGVELDEVVVTSLKNKQTGNYDAETGSIDAKDGAGVMLYSVSGSTRASAKDARKAREVISKAKKEGKLDDDAEVNIENLVALGISEEKAMEYNTAYGVYSTAAKRAQDGDIISGFGNNGGEEFLSFLQTGESLAINNDSSWKNWYDNTTGRLINIQNNDGSWNGHHCITSPVFCTATCLLILSIDKDIERLIEIGNDSNG